VTNFSSEGDSMPRFRPAPMSPDEIRNRRWRYRLIAYVDGVLLFVLMLAFSPEWFLMFIIWLIANFVILTWDYRNNIRNRRMNVVGWAEEDSILINMDIHRQLMTALRWDVVGGAVFLVAGFFNPWGFAMAAFMGLSGVGVYWIAKRYR
jgi:uncharacterized membrane protein